MSTHTLSLTYEERQLLKRALDGLSNYMQTGTLTHSSLDIEAMGNDKPANFPGTIRGLTEDQMGTILEINRLKRKLA